MDPLYKPYRFTPHYYETDAMGIVHHSNYIRRFEDTRLDFLAQAGYPYERMEEEGLMIPVRGVSVEFKNAVRFGDNVEIMPTIKEFNGFNLKVTYTVKNADTGILCATGTSEHFFTDKNLRPVRTKHKYPDVYKVFYDALEK
jgi:acyl-CoA thioester hydrolase